MMLIQIRLLLVFASSLVCRPSPQPPAIHISASLLFMLLSSFVNFFNFLCVSLATLQEEAIPWQGHCLLVNPSVHLVNNSTSVELQTMRNRRTKVETGHCCGLHAKRRSQSKSDPFISGQQPGVVRPDISSWVPF